MFIPFPSNVLNFKAVELFLQICYVQDIIGGYRYDIFALDHTYETTLTRTHQAQNGTFSIFNALFLPKIAIVNTYSKKILTKMIKVFNILFLETLEHKEKLFKLVHHLLYSQYDLSKKLLLKKCCFFAKMMQFDEFQFYFCSFFTCPILSKNTFQTLLRKFINNIGSYNKV